MKRKLKAFLTAMVAVLMLTATMIPVLAIGPETKGASTGYQNVASEYIALNTMRRTPFISCLNEDNVTRTVYNKTLCDQLPTLRYNAELEKAAKVRAKEIVVLFDHRRPNGQSWDTAYPYLRSLGENIAYGQDSVPEVMKAFAEADKPYSGQGHRRNMLSPKFNAVGCACYKVNGVCYWVQCFGRV